MGSLTSTTAGAPPTPDALVDHACAVAGLRDGVPVLEVGCGTGQLTRSLLARGLRVTALEPGDRLAAVAARNLADAGALNIIVSTLEDARLQATAHHGRLLGYGTALTRPLALPKH